MVLCAPAGGQVNYYRQNPVRIVVNPDADATAIAGAIEFSLENLKQIAIATGLEVISVSDIDPLTGSMLSNALEYVGALPQTRILAQVDLTAGPTAWRSALRKSSRSLINWGRRHMQVDFVNRDNLDLGQFRKFQEFHAQVAGRVTRPQESWDEIFAWISAGGGELTMTSIDKKPAAASLFIDGTSCCLYFTGVYDRTNFDKPMAHYPLWLGIERAHERGMKTLELGDVPEEGAVSAKEYQIGYFKRGFATHLEKQVTWTWHLR